MIVFLGFLLQQRHFGRVALLLQMVRMVRMVDGRAEHLGRFDVLLQLLHVALELGAPVLKPGDDLRIGQAERQGDLVAVGRRQVLLIEEPLLQLEYLVVGEGRARLALLLGLLARTEQLRMTRSVTCNNNSNNNCNQFSKSAAT